MAAVRTFDVVRGTIALSAGLVDTVVAHIDEITGCRGYILVTGLTPRSTDLQIVQP